MLIRGSLCPDGGIVKLAVADDRRLEFAGPAVVFDSPPEALDGVRAGKVRAGQVVVLRGQGVTGSPGMGMASQLVFALDGAGLTGQVAVVTDGQLSGLVNKGIVVGEVSPEAAAGGPLALVGDGDTIRIDVPGRTADLDVPAAELAAQEGGPAPARPHGAGGRLAVGLPAPGPPAPRRARCCGRGRRRRDRRERRGGRRSRQTSRWRSAGCRWRTGTWWRCTTRRSRVAEGDACAITGPNGNGKSSILMGITGMVRRRGAVEIFGAPAPNGDVRWAARHGPHPGAGTPPALPGPVRGRQHHPRLLHLDEEHREGEKVRSVRARR